jgi:hypothetical protein
MIRGAQVGVDGGGALADDPVCRGHTLEEWFAHAAAGNVPDEGDSPGRVLLAAATLPVRDAMVRPPRLWRGVPRALGAVRLRRRGLALTTMVSLVVLAVVTVAATGSLGSSSNSPTPAGAGFEPATFRVMRPMAGGAELPLLRLGRPPASARDQFGTFLAFPGVVRVRHRGPNRWFCRGLCSAGGGTRTPDTRIMIPLL